MREYLNGKTENVYLVNVLTFNADGYIEKLYRGSPNPKSDIPEEGEATAMFEYFYEKQDSFIVQSSRIIRFKTDGGDNIPDTSNQDIKILNIKKATEFRNQGNGGNGGNGGKRTYMYDENIRLVAIFGINDEPLFTIQYINENEIQVDEHNQAWGAIIKSTVRYNEEGLIVQNYNESAANSHEFIYNEKGELVELIAQYKFSEKSIIQTFEYVR